MKRICKDCQYYREKSWCSNSKSPSFRYGNRDYPFVEVFMMADGTCDQFTERGKKAPIVLRAINAILAARKR